MNECRFAALREHKASDCPECNPGRWKFEPCETPGCDGDARYMPPGRGHNDQCTERWRAALTVFRNA